MSTPIDYLVKIVDVGSSGIGKSELIKAICNDPYRYSTDTPGTIGIEFGSRIVENDNKKFKLQFWDTSGNPTFQSVTKSYYRGTTLFLLCFDTTNLESLEQLKSYISDIRDIVKTPYFILVGTKSDLTVERQVSDNDIENFCRDTKLQDTSTLITSSRNHDKTGKEKPSSGIDNLVNTITAYSHRILAQEATQTKQTVSPGNKSNSYNSKAQAARLFTKLKIATTIGITATAAAATVTVLACVGILTNPLIFGIAIGVLGIIAISSLLYASAKAYQTNQAQTITPLSV